VVEAGYNHGGDSRSSWFYRPDLYDWHNPAQAQGWTQGVHAGTGRYKHDTDRSLNYHPTIEMIDYDAYNKDAFYSSGAKGMGLEGGKVAKLQDIYDIEEWYAGAGERNAEKQKQAEAQLAATNEQISLLQQQLEDSRKPREIDVGQGRTVGEGGVADYVLGLEQQRAEELDYLTRMLSSQYDTKYNNAQEAWGSRYNQQQSDWMSRYNQQQSDWMSKSATRDREYNSRISDLTSDWDAQRSAYDTSLYNLNQSITDYQNREQRRAEQAAIESQRSRTAAAYASGGRTVNQGVGGVKTQRGLTYPQRNRYGSSFKRSDMSIVNKQLNI